MAFNIHNYDEMPELVREYLMHISISQEKSQQTIYQYAGDLRLFFRFTLLNKGLESNGRDISEIDISKLDGNFICSLTSNDAYEFLAYCKNTRGNNASTRSRKGISIRRFYHYLFTSGVCDSDPMQRLELPKKKKVLPKYLTLDESRALLNSVDGNNKERNYCIITLFLNCGMRLSELVSLNYNNIRDDRTVVITGKGNKERVVYLNDAAWDAIHAYLAVRPNEGLKANDKYALFISRNMRRINQRQVQYIVKDFMKKAGLDRDGLSVHKLRHTAATLMYRYGNVDVLLIKEILGHESLSTTEIYTHVVNEQLRDATKKNPLSGAVDEDEVENVDDEESQE